MGLGPRVLDLNKREGRPTQSVFLPPDIKYCWTWQSSLLRDPRLRVFSIPKSAAPKRQTEEPANGRTQSVNFVFARHSQPVCARFSRVPPSVSGAPFWQHGDEPYLSPSCVWHRYFFSRTSLHSIRSFLPQSRCLSSTAKCDSDKEKVAYGFRIVRVGWVATSRHARGAQRHLECGVRMIPFFGLRVFPKWRPKLQGAPKD